MDKLERRLIQLKIEQEAVKKEKDEASQRRLRPSATKSPSSSGNSPTWTRSGGPRRPRSRVRPTSRRKSTSSSCRWIELQRKGQYDKLAELQYGKLPQLEAQLKAVEKSAGGEQKFKLLRTQVGAEEIAEVVSRATGIPVSKMMQGAERDKLLKMEERLHKRVVGQDEAVRLVADAIRRSRPACRTPTGPMAPSSSSAPRGRQDRTVQGLAEFLFDSEEHLIRIDMSEFMEKHSVARLIGAPRATSATRRAAT